MSWEHLFSRCPVLPADASISLARYLHTLRETSNQIPKEEKTDPERALLLQIRVLQLICKTLPSHPGYRLPENRQLLRELRVLAHAGFAYLERRAANQEINNNSVNKDNGRVYDRTCVPGSLVELFRRIARENISRGEVVVSILGGTETNEGKQFDVRALVIPAQNAGRIRYPADVEQLLRVKGLVCVGVIFDGIEDSLKGYEEVLEDITVRGKETIGLAPSDAVIDTFILNKRRWQKTEHVEINENAFKLYDLRPLATARDDKNGNATE